MNHDTLITTAEAAKIRGVSQRTIQHWIYEFGLPCKRFGPAKRVLLLVSRADLDAFQAPPRGNPDFVAGKPRKKKRRKAK